MRGALLNPMRHVLHLWAPIRQFLFLVSFLPRHLLTWKAPFRCLPSSAVPRMSARLAMQDRPVLHLELCGVVKNASHQQDSWAVALMLCPSWTDALHIPHVATHPAQEALSVSGNTSGYSQRPRQVGAYGPCAQSKLPSNPGLGSGTSIVVSITATRIVLTCFNPSIPRSGCSQDNRSITSCTHLDCG